MSGIRPEDDTELWEVFCELVAKASAPSSGPTEDEEVFGKIDRLLAEDSRRSGTLILMLAFYAHRPLHRLLTEHFDGSSERVRKAKIIIGWPVVSQASPVMQMATDLVATACERLTPEETGRLLAVLEDGWANHSRRYVQLLNCMVNLVAALREGTVSIGPALESAP